MPENDAGDRNRDHHDASAMTVAPPSPCTGVCSVDQARALCIGCGRSLDEIARWAAAGAAEQQAITARAQARKATLA